MSPGGLGPRLLRRQALVKRLARGKKGVPTPAKARASAPTSSSSSSSSSSTSSSSSASASLPSSYNLRPEYDLFRFLRVPTRSDDEELSFDFAKALRASGNKGWAVRKKALARAALKCRANGEAVLAKVSLQGAEAGLHEFVPPVVKVVKSDSNVQCVAAAINLLQTMAEGLWRPSSCSGDAEAEGRHAASDKDHRHRHRNPFRCVSRQVFGELLRRLREKHKTVCTAVARCLDTL